MTEQQPMGTTTQPAAAPTTDEHAAETKRLSDQLYAKRKTMDPLLYDRVIAYHPFAGQSDDAFAVFVADYERLEGEAKAAEPAAAPAKPAG